MGVSAETTRCPPRLFTGALAGHVVLDVSHPDGEHRQKTHAQPDEAQATIRQDALLCSLGKEVPKVAEQLLVGLGSKLANGLDFDDFC